MKNINKKYKAIISGLFLSTVFFVSCDDILETIPTDRISSEIYWQNEQDAEYAADAIYPYLDGKQIVQYDGLTDILHANIQFSDQAQMERGEFDSNVAFVQTVWSNYYKGIRAVNSFVEHVSPLEQSEKIIKLTNEVRVIRAYLYMNLVMLYGDVPLVTKSIESVPESKEYSRTPVADVWKYVVEELAAAASGLPVDVSEKGRITQGAANALLARAYLYQGKWAEAETAAKKVIDSKKYELFASYENLFRYENENNCEVILDKQYIRDSYSNNMFSFLAPFSLKKQGPSFVPTKRIVDAYYMKNGKAIDETGSDFSLETQYENRDPRLSYSVYLPGDELPNGEIYEPTPGKGGGDEIASTYLATSLGYNIKKYINKEDLDNPSNCGINIILLRYAEVLLTYAEARIEQGKLDAITLDAINQVRSRADVQMPNVKEGLDQASLRSIVRHERMVELAFEGVRLFDCRRWKNAEQLFKGEVEGLTYQETDGTWKTVKIGGFLKVFDAQKHYLWPIPQKEMDLNPNYVQNPGW